MRLVHSFSRIFRTFVALPFRVFRIFSQPKSHRALPHPKMCNTGGDKQFQNVLLLSISFMFVFTAFQTMGNIEQTVLESIAKDDPTFTGNGYTSLSIIYAVFSLSNWIAPSVVAILSAKWSMVLGAAVYTAFIASFLHPTTTFLYGMSAVLGVAAAVIWTAQGNYLTLSSNELTMSRNSGMFWAILQSSMFFGNSFVFWQFAGESDEDANAEGKANEIRKQTRVLVFSVLTAVSIIGVISMCFLRKPEEAVEPIGEEGASSENQQISRAPETPLKALQDSLRLFTKPTMILLFFTFFYTGTELSFFSGVYSSAIGFTKRFPESKRLVGLCGILVGVGEVFGGALFGLLGSKTVKHGRDPIVLLGFISHSLAYYLVFLNIPDMIPDGPTWSGSYIASPSVLVAMFCAFLLGFGDSCFQTQIYSILGGLYPDESSQAFALFKFSQSAAAAASFFYSSKLSLRWQLGMLQAFCTIGTLTFFLVEWASVKAKVNQDEEDGDDGGGGGDEQHGVIRAGGSLYTTVQQDADDEENTRKK